MSLITWSDELSVNIKEFDSQHRQLVEMVNTLHRAMKEGQTAPTIKSTVQRLVDYTETHFAAEEEAMKAYNYPGYIAHRGEHHTLTLKVLDFQKQIQTNPIGVSVQMMSFLKTWLLEHIQGTDKKYSKYLNNQGLQ